MSVDLDWADAPATTQVKRVLRDAKEYVLADREEIAKILSTIGSTGSFEVIWNDLVKRVAEGAFDHSGMLPISEKADVLIESASEWCEALWDADFTDWDARSMYDEGTTFVVLGYEDPAHSNSDNYILLLPVSGQTSVTEADMTVRMHTTAMHLENGSGMRHSVHHDFFAAPVLTSAVWTVGSDERLHPVGSANQRDHLLNYALVSLAVTASNAEELGLLDSEPDTTLLRNAGTAEFFLPAIADFIGFDGETSTAEVTEASTGQSVRFIPSHKDSRPVLAVDATMGGPRAFLEVIRCSVCNGRVKLSMSADSVKTMKAMECPHCGDSQGVMNPYNQEVKA